MHLYDNLAEGGKYIERPASPARCSRREVAPQSVSGASGLSFKSPSVNQLFFCPICFAKTPFLLSRITKVSLNVKHIFSTLGLFFAQFPFIPLLYAR